MNIEISEPIISTQVEYEYNDRYGIDYVIASVVVGGVTVLTRRYHTNREVAKEASSSGFVWEDPTYVDADRVEADSREKVLAAFGTRLKELFSGPE